MKAEPVQPHGEVCDKITAELVVSQCHNYSFVIFLHNVVYVIDDLYQILQLEQVVHYYMHVHVECVIHVCTNNGYYKMHVHYVGLNYYSSCPCERSGFYVTTVTTKTEHSRCCPGNIGPKHPVNLSFWKDDYSAIETNGKRQSSGGEE